MKFVSFLFLTVLACINTVSAQYVDTVVKYQRLDMYEGKLVYVNPQKYGFHFIEVCMRTVDSTWHVKKFHESNKAPVLEAIFKDDSFKIAHGNYLSYHYNGTLREEGRFVDGKRVGLWKTYNNEGKLVDSSRYKNKGTPYYKCYHWYNNGQLQEFLDFDTKGEGSGYETDYFPDGTKMHFGKYAPGMVEDSVWTYYDSYGTITLQETYDSGKLQKAVCYNPLGNEIPCGDTAFKAPEPNGDMEQFQAMLMMDNVLPEEAKKAGIKDPTTVFVAFTVDMNGKIVSPEISIGSHPSINEKALQIFRDMEPWKPARYKGRAIQMDFSLPITFN